MPEEVFEQIIEREGTPLYRVAYPVTFKDKEYLVIQKRKPWHTEWRGGLFINIQNSDDVGIVEEIIEAMLNVLTAAGWEDLLT